MHAHLSLHLHHVLMDEEGVPRYSELLWPTLRAARDLGGSGSISELNEKVAQLQQFSEEQQRVLHGDGPQSEIDYRLAWARTYLKMMNLLTNSSRGVWSVTEQGREVNESDVPARHAQALTAMRRRRETRRPDEPGSSLESEADDEPYWKDDLLDALMAMTPDGFERLAQRLLREAGFTSATVTGRSGDGGIDGLGVYRMSLVSFPVFFQCKRYRGSVGAGAVRDFRGAMAGRGDEGLLITTGSFTAEARAEATRDGAPPVDRSIARVTDRG
jgi:restriction system protein